MNELTSFCSVKLAVKVCSEQWGEENRYEFPKTIEWLWICWCRALCWMLTETFLLFDVERLFTWLRRLSLVCWTICSLHITQEIRSCLSSTEFELRHNRKSLVVTIQFFFSSHFKIRNFVRISRFCSVFLSSDVNLWKSRKRNCSNGNELNEIIHFYEFSAKKCSAIRIRYDWTIVWYSYSLVISGFHIMSEQREQREQRICFFRAVTLVLRRRHRIKSKFLSLSLSSTFEQLHDEHFMVMTLHFISFHWAHTRRSADTWRNLLLGKSK